MKETKTFLLLFVSILLLAVSITLLWSWGSQFRQLNQVVQQKQSVPLPVTATKRFGSDTLREVYQAALLHLDKSIDSVWNSATIVKEDLAIKLASFYKLRTEITALFNEEQTAENILLARIKIIELQGKIRELNLTNSDIDRENKRLLAVIRSLNSQTALSVNPAIRENSNFSIPKPEPILAETAGPVFFTSDIYFAAIKESGNKEIETTSANDASRFEGSFMVRAKGSQDLPEEVMVVVLQPDGRVLQKSTWESGSFETATGKKIYSCKIQVQPSNGEARKLNFSLNTDNPQKGSYIIQLYHNGKLIGNVRRSLS